MIKQISVFTEDKPGKIMNITKILDDNKITIKSITIDRANEYGTIKLLVDKPDETIAVFKKLKISYKYKKVLVIEMKNAPGGIFEISKILLKHNINLKDAYGFVTENKNTLMVIEVDEISKVRKIFKDKGLKMLTDKTMNKI